MLKKKETKESSIKFLKSCFLCVAVSGLSQLQLQLGKGERLEAQLDYSLTTTAIGIDSVRKLKEAFSKYLKYFQSSLKTKSNLCTNRKLY